MICAIPDIDSLLHGFIASQRNGKFPIGLLAQLVERCTGVVEVRGSNQIEAWKIPL